MKLPGRSAWLHEQELTRWGAALVLAVMVLTTYAVPCMFGYSWFPLPMGIGSPCSCTAPRFPSHGSLAAADIYSMPQTESPWRKFLADSFRKGEFPMWNPYNSLGIPFAAQYEPQVFLPLEWLESMCVPLGWNVLLLLKMWLAAFGAFLLYQSFGLRSLGALLGAMSYLFSGFFLWLHTVPDFINGVVLIPWVFLYTWHCAAHEQFGARPTGVLALLVGVLWLTGQPQMSLLTSAAACLLFTAGVARTQRLVGAAQRVLCFGLANVLGLMLAAIQIGIFERALPDFYNLHPPNSHFSSATAPLNLVNSVLPYVFGQLMRPWDPDLFPAAINWEGFPMVIGGLGLMLLSLAVVQIAFSVLSWSLPSTPRAVVTLFLLALLILVPLVHDTLSGPDKVWVRPYLTQINVPRYCVPILSIALAGLMGWAVTLAGRLSRIRFLLGISPGLVLLGLAAWSISSTVQDAGTKTDFSYLKLSLWLSVGGCLLPLVAFLVIGARRLRCLCSETRAEISIVLCMFAELASFVRYGFDLQFESFRLIGLCLLLGAALWVSWRPTWGMSSLLVGCSFASTCVLMAMSGQATSLSHLDVHYAEAPAHVEALRKIVGTPVLGRTLTTSGLIYPNEGSAFGLTELNAVNPMQVSTTAKYFLKALADRPIHGFAPVGWPGMESAADDASLYPSWSDYLRRRPYYNVIGVRFLIDAPGGFLSSAKAENMPVIYRDGRVAVYEDQQSLPRAFAATRVRTVEGYDDALRLLLSSKTDLSTAPIVETTRALPAALTSNAPAPVKPLKIAYFAANRVDVDVDANHECLVVLADAYFPGWRAYADGKLTRIHRVNTTVRGVVVEPGTKCVSFRFWPEHFSKLLTISGTAGVCSLALLLFPSWRRRRSKCALKEPA